MRRHRCLLSLAAIGVLAVAACGGGRVEDDDVPRATVGTMATSTTTTTSAASAAETTTSSTEPLSREDFLRHKVVELFATENSLLHHPDPNRLTEWLSPNCSCFAQEKAVLEDLAANGHHLDGTLVEILGVELSGEDASYVSLTVVWRRPSARVVDSSGAVVQDRPATGPSGAAVDLARDLRGQWLVHVIVELQLPPERIDEIIRKGLP